MNFLELDIPCTDDKLMSYSTYQSHLIHATTFKTTVLLETTSRCSLSYYFILFIIHNGISNYHIHVMFIFCLTLLDFISSLRTRDRLCLQLEAIHFWGGQGGGRGVCRGVVVVIHEMAETTRVFIAWLIHYFASSEFSVPFGINWWLKGYIRKTVTKA